MLFSKPTTSSALERGEHDEQRRDARRARRRSAGAGSRPSGTTPNTAGAHVRGATAESRSRSPLRSSTLTRQSGRVPGLQAVNRTARSSAAYCAPSLRSPRPQDVWFDRRLAFLDATAQAELVARGDVARASSSTRRSPASNGSNPELNAVIHQRFERARDEAGSAAAGPAPRRAVPREGRGVPHRRRPVPLRHARAQGRAAGPRPDDTWLAARFRPAGFVFVGQDQHARARVELHDRTARVRRDAQSVGPHAEHGWVERRLGGGGRGRARARSRTATTWAARSASPRRCAASSGSSRPAPAPPSAPTSASTGAR